MKVKFKNGLRPIFISRRSPPRFRIAVVSDPRKAYHEQFDYLIHAAACFFRRVAVRGPARFCAMVLSNQGFI
jgi:hypothetical protein